MTEYIELSEFMEMLDINTKAEGETLWNIIANRRVFVDGVEVGTSSFRGNAAMIAERCGGDYLDYYCAGRNLEAEEKIMNKFIDLNVSTREV